MKTFFWLCVITDSCSAYAVPAGEGKDNIVSARYHSCRAVHDRTDGIIFGGGSGSPSVVLQSTATKGISTTTPSEFSISGYSTTSFSPAIGHNARAAMTSASAAFSLTSTYSWLFGDGGEHPTIGNAAGFAYTSHQGFQSMISKVASIASYASAASASPASVMPVPTASADSTSSASNVAVLNAACDFHNKGIGWSFVIKDMNEWVGDGSRLHHHEDGCGALTGWHFQNLDGRFHANFNLPFFIEDGCVERAIHSAGGPSGLRCKGHGGFESRPAGEEAFSNLNISAEEFFLANAKKPVHESLATRSDPQGVSGYTNPRLLQQRSYELIKRGCWPSKVSASSGHLVPHEWTCNAVIPGVDDCLRQIAAEGNVGRKTSLFYTAAVSQTTCSQWATRNLASDSWVVWNGIVDTSWRYATTDAIRKPFGPNGRNLQVDDLSAKSDPFEKNLAQAFGEASVGRAYICIPSDKAPNDNWDTNSAWGGWEYPALTRTPATGGVTEIYRVDPTKNDPPRPVWVRANGDGPSAQEPKGIRAKSLPVGLPNSHLPPDWQGNH